MKRKLLTYSLSLFILLSAACSEHEEPEQKLDANKQETNQSSKSRLANGDIFDGTEGDPIDLKLASEWTHRWQKENQTGIRAHFYGREILQQLLSQEGSVGIRFYYGLDEKGNRQLVLVGVNAKGEDLLPSFNSRTSAENYFVADKSTPCPSTCPPNDELQ